MEYAQWAVCYGSRCKESDDIMEGIQVGREERKEGRGHLLCACAFVLGRERGMGKGRFLSGPAAASF